MTSVPIKITNGNLTVNPLMWQHFTASEEGITCNVVPRKAKRSSTQNSYYWLYLTIVSARTANGIKDLHDFFRGEFR